MAKTKISEFDIDPANNTDINSINIAEGCAPSGINNAIRQLMSDLKEFQTGAGGDPFNGAVNGTVGATTPNTGAFTTLTASSTATLNTLSSSGATITGGSINGTTVGATTASTGAFTTLSASGAFSANGGATLGDASGDALTINSSAVSIPNGLNFDSNTLVIDATNNRVGIGTSSPAGLLDVNKSSGGDIFVRSNNSALRFVSTGGENYIQSGTATTGSSPADLVFTNVGGTSERMRLDSSGNLGLGVTPSAWWHSGNIQLPSGSLWSRSGDPSIGISANAYSSTSGGGWKYVANGYASFYQQYNGSHTWQIASSGTAGNAISFTQAMTLDASGNLMVGTTSSSSGITIERSGATSAEIKLNQTGASGRDFRISSTGSGYGSAGNLIFYDATAAAERMRIDSSGNVMIGNTSYAYKISAARQSDGVVGYFRRDGATINPALMIVANETGNTVGFSTDYAGATSPAMTFTTQGSERMRIDSSGNLLVGTTSQTYGENLSVQNSGGSGNAALFYYTSTDDRSVVIVRAARATGATTASMITFLNASGTGVGGVFSTGSATSYATSSDYRLKENIAPMTGALATVAQLKPVTYSWKADGSSGQGFIAHELQAVVPDCVTGEKDAVDADGNPVYQGIDTSFLVATLTAALQEAHGLIKDLQARVDALESK